MPISQNYNKEKGKGNCI